MAPVSSKRFTKKPFEIELTNRSIPLEPQKAVVIFYKGHKLKREYVVDLLCYGQILIELKALDGLSGKEESQILNYLKATGLRIGLLINFGTPGKLEWKRFVN